MLITQTLAKWSGAFVLWGSSWGAGTGLPWGGGRIIQGELAVKAEDASFTLTAWTLLLTFLSTCPWPPPRYPRFPYHSKNNSLEISHWNVSLPRKHSYLSTNNTTSCSSWVNRICPKESSVKPTTKAASGSRSLYSALFLVTMVGLYFLLKNTFPSTCLLSSTPNTDTVILPYLSSVASALALLLSASFSIQKCCDFSYIKIVSCTYNLKRHMSPKVHGSTIYNS